MKPIIRHAISSVMGYIFGFSMARFIDFDISHSFYIGMMSSIIILAFSMTYPGDKNNE
jgi:hypothetical protein